MLYCLCLKLKDVDWEWKWIVKEIKWALEWINSLTGKWGKLCNESSTACTFDERALRYTQDNQREIQETGGRWEIYVT